MAVLKYKNPNYVVGGAEEKYLPLSNVIAGNSEIYIGETEPTNDYIMWINPADNITKYKYNDTWVELIDLQETVIISLVSNQDKAAVPDPDLLGKVIHVTYSDQDKELIWQGEPLKVTIPINMTYQVVFPTNEHYKCPIQQEYIALAGDTREVKGYYYTEVVTVNVSGVSSGFTVTVNGQSQTTTSETYYIPYDTAYTISASSVKGYSKKISESSIIASQQTRTVTVTYAKIPNGIYICDNTGTLTAVGSWNTSNNSSAIGVAVVSDNCSFVIGKTQSVSGIAWSSKLYGTFVSGIVNATNSDRAKTDYAGEANSSIVRGLTSGETNAFNWAYSNTITVNETTLYGYIGALGEWQTAYNNKSSIDSALSKIGGTAMLEGFNWASTQDSSNYAWISAWSNFYTTTQNRNKDTNCARAFYPLP